jgi:lipoprotein-anchoring transpeptidase ErfK/SrfK
MFRNTVAALTLSASFLIAGLTGDASAQYASQVNYNGNAGMGGGFIEFLFGGPHHQQQQSPYQQPHRTPQYAPQPYQQPAYQQQYQPQHQQQYQPQYQQQYQPAYQQQAPYQHEPAYQDQRQAYAPAEPARHTVDPRFNKQVVAYSGREAAGTIVIDTPSKFLYLVQGDGSALRYGIGVGRPGFTWAGVKTISMKKEWPSWTPPAEMLKRRPDLPRFMEGGPENPLGARAMYLGSTLYRIHGSNEPWTIGTQVSSGCIRLRNEDVIDLYNRVKVGTRVVVI